MEIVLRLFSACIYFARYSYRVHHAHVRQFIRWRREYLRVGERTNVKTSFEHIGMFRVQRSVVARSVPRDAVTALSTLGECKTARAVDIERTRGAERCRKQGLEGADLRTCRVTSPQKDFSTTECTVFFFTGTSSKKCTEKRAHGNLERQCFPFSNTSRYMNRLLYRYS